MDRRTAIQVLGAAVGASMLPAMANAKDDRPKCKTAVGLNGFMSSSQDYQKTYPIWEILDFVNQAGFDGVELVEGWPMGHYPAADQTTRIHALRRLYDGFGLQVFSIQMGVSAAFDPDPTIRKRWLDHMRDRVSFAKQVGCDCVGMWPGGPLRGQSIDDAIDRAMASSDNRQQPLS